MKILEQIEQKVSLSRGTEHVDDLFGGREHPDIALPRLQLDLRLVNMDQPPGDQPCEDLIGRGLIHRSEEIPECDDLLGEDRQTEEFVD